MKWIYNHIEIIWAIFVVWFVSFFIVCECLSPARDYIVAFLVLLGIGIILFTILIRYFLYHPKGREAVRMAEEIRREKEQRRRELYEELDKKYKGVDLPDDLLEPVRRDEDIGCPDFNINSSLKNRYMAKQLCCAAKEFIGNLSN